MRFSRISHSYLRQLWDDGYETLAAEDQLRESTYREVRNKALLFPFFSYTKNQYLLFTIAMVIFPLFFL